MKKLTLILITICMLFTTTYAYNLTKIVQGNKLITTIGEAKNIIIRYTDMVGYIFNGWNVTGITLNNLSSKTLNFIMPENDVIIEANTSIQNYTITYTLNGGTATNPTTYTINDSIILTEPTKGEEPFLGWTGSNGSTPQKTVVIPKGSSGDKSYIANWGEVESEEISYTVYHYLENANDTGYTLNNAENKTGEVGTTITLSNFVSNTGDLAYANYSYGSTTNGGSAVTSTTVENNRNIYLYYTRKTYALTLNKNSYVTSVSGASTYKWGKNVDISATLGSETGYTYSFTNWTSNNTSLLANQTGQSTTIIIPKGAVTLTATGSKSANTYTIVYNANGGTGTTNSSIHTYGISKELTANGFSKTGYTFLGWSTSSTATEATYTDGQSVTNLTSTSNDTITLYAVWEETKYTITVTQGENGTISPATASVNSGESQTFIITPSIGYKISAVLVDGVNVGAIKTYTFNDVTTNHTITASYSEFSGLLTDLEIGEYITYVPTSTSYKAYEVDTGYGTDDSNSEEYQEFNPSETTLWRVMYNNNGQIDIISADAVYTTSDVGLYLKGITGYAKIVDTLNDISGAYVNELYATGARHLGSTNNSVGTITDTSLITFDYLITQDHYSDEPYTDLEYEEDFAQINTNSLLNESGSVWSATRLVIDSTTATKLSLFGRALTTTGDKTYTGFLSAGNEISATLGIRPIVSLRSGVEITGGSGTKDAPYILKEPETCKLTVDANGGTWSDGTTGKKIFIGLEGDSIILPITPKSGNITLTFDANGGTINGNSSYSVTQPYNWVKASTSGSEYTGTYEEAARTYTFASGDSYIFLIYYSKFLALDYTPVRNGYTFKGWNYNADGSGINIGFPFTISTSNTFYAKWE